jgi:hypothetical protein
MRIKTNHARASSAGRSVQVSARMRKTQKDAKKHQCTYLETKIVEIVVPLVDYNRIQALLE